MERNSATLVSRVAGAGQFLRKRKTRPCLQGFAELYAELLGARVFSPDDASAYEGRARAWVAQFVVLHGPKRVTPYVHAFACHVGPQLARHGSIRLYSCSGAEQRHYVDKMVLFRNCRFGQRWCLSLMRREHRRLLARCLGLDRAARKNKRARAEAEEEGDAELFQEGDAKLFEELGLASSSARCSDSA